MAEKKICDFCLETEGTFFHPLYDVPGGYYICQNCREILKKYNLPIRNDLFQQLVTHEPSLREMIMRNYLEGHTKSDTLAKYFPTGTKILHNREHLISAQEVTLTVPKDLIPDTLAKTEIVDITKQDILNIEDAHDGQEAEIVSGMLYETSGAIYFMSEHFINAHHINNLVMDSTDTSAIHVQENHHPFTYHTVNADLFLLRHQFYFLMNTYTNEKNQNIIYLASENTMTLTPGIYSVPKNIKSGTYYLSSLGDNSLNVRDAAGQVTQYMDGLIELLDGSQIECSSEHQLRINPHEEEKEEDTQSGQHP